MLKKELIPLIDNAYKLLNANLNSEFYQNKSLIKEIFSLTKNNPNKEKVRLTVIDSFYSTNMNKLNGGISDLSDALKNISKDDEKLSEEFLSYLNDDDENEYIDHILKKTYGKNRKKPKGTKAVSLISKYGYFLTEFNFPIYDSLMKETIKELKRQNCFTEKATSYGLEKDYFNLLYKITFSLGENGIDRFDAFGWLTGKIRKAIKSNTEDASLIGSLKDYEDFKKKLQEFKLL